MGHRIVKLGLSLMLILIGSASGGPATATEAIYAFDFQTDPMEAGWTSEAADQAAAWRHGAGIDGTHCLDISMGLWKSPRLDLPPHTLYMLRFQSKTEHAAYWEVKSIDGEGRQILGSVCSGVYGSEDWIDNEFAVMTPYQPADGGCFIAFWPIRDEALINTVSLTPATREEALRVADRAYDAMPPLTVALAPDRWTNIPDTILKLHTGRELRMVIIGDSVANDLANSLFHLQVERRYPGTVITVINSVYGSAGAGHYLPEERFMDDIARYDPDLVILAGAHHGRHRESCRTLATRIREDIGAEFLVFTEQWVYVQRFGNADRGWDAFEQASREDGYAVFHLGGHWERYVKETGNPLEWFQRDFIHNNDRGRQIIARLAALYFEPTGNEAIPVIRTGSALRPTPATDVPVAVEDAPPREIAELIGTIVRMSTPITPARAGAYRDAFFHIEYRVDRVISGRLDEARVLTVQPCLTDGHPHPSVAYEIGQRHRLTLTRWDAIPTHETMLVADDVEEDLEAVRYFPSALRTIRERWWRR